MSNGTSIVLALLGWTMRFLGEHHSAPSTSAAVPPAAHVVDIVARDFFFQAPDTVPAGLVTLRLRVEQGSHIAALARLDAGHTAADLLRSRKEGHARPAWMHLIGGPGFPATGGTANASMVLTPGNYIIMCDVADSDRVPHFEKGMYHALVVRPAVTAAPASLPKPDGVVTIRDYSFKFSVPLHAGDRTLRVENRGNALHEFRLVHVLPGHTARESLAWKPEDRTPRPDEDVTALVGLVPGGDLTTTVRFEPGEYVVFCGPQMAHGMIQPLRVLPATR